MTALEIFLTIVLWIIIGLWISYKRNWYQESSFPDEIDVTAGILILINCVFMPIVFMWTFFKEYLNDEWDIKR